MENQQENHQKQLPNAQEDPYKQDLDSLADLAIEALKINHAHRQYRHIRSLQAFCSRMVFFANLNSEYEIQDVAKRCSNHMYFCQVPGNEIFLNFDRPSHFIYIFIRGRVRELRSKGVEALDGKLERLQSGGKFGQLVQFNHNADQNSKIVTLKPSQFLVMPKIAFYSVLGKLEKKSLQECMTHLWNFSFHRNWSYEAIKQLALKCKILALLKNQVVCDRGEIEQGCNEIFFVRNGEFKIFATATLDSQTQSPSKTPLQESFSIVSRRTIELGTLAFGDIFGEECLLEGEEILAQRAQTGKKRQYRVVCSSKYADVYSVPKDVIEQAEKQNGTLELFMNSMREIFRYRQQKFEEIQQRNKENSRSIVSPGLEQKDSQQQQQQKQQEEDTNTSQPSPLRLRSKSENRIYHRVWKRLFRQSSAVGGSATAQPSMRNLVRREPSNAEVRQIDSPLAIQQSQMEASQDLLKSTLRARYNQLENATTQQPRPLQKNEAEEDGAATPTLLAADQQKIEKSASNPTTSEALKKKGAFLNTRQVPMIEMMRRQIQKKLRDHHSNILTRSNSANTIIGFQIPLKISSFGRSTGVQKAQPDIEKAVRVASVSYAQNRAQPATEYQSPVLSRKPSTASAQTRILHNHASQETSLARFQYLRDLPQPFLQPDVRQLNLATRGKNSESKASQSILKPKRFPISDGTDDEYQFLYQRERNQIIGDDLEEEDGKIILDKRYSAIDNQKNQQQQSVKGIRLRVSTAKEISGSKKRQNASELLINVSCSENQRKNPLFQQILRHNSQEQLTRPVSKVGSPEPKLQLNYSKVRQSSAQLNRQLINVNIGSQIDSSADKGAKIKMRLKSGNYSVK